MRMVNAAGNPASARLSDSTPSGAAGRTVQPAVSQRSMQVSSSSVSTGLVT